MSYIQIHMYEYWYGYRFRCGGIGITLTFINCVHRVLSSFDLHTHLRFESCVTWRRLLLLLILLLPLHLRSLESQSPPEAEELDPQQREYQPHEQHGRGKHGANNKNGLLTCWGMTGLVKSVGIFRAGHLPWPTFFSWAMSFCLTSKSVGSAFWIKSLVGTVALCFVAKSVMKLHHVANRTALGSANQLARRLIER